MKRVLKNIVTKLLDRIEANNPFYELLSVMICLGMALVGITLFICTYHIIVGLFLFIIGGGLVLSYLTVLDWS